jgi:predicted nucleic acid-binding protein
LTYLLDTNVVSELRKVAAGKAHRRVAAWAESVDALDLFVSAITIHELEIGVQLKERRDARQGAILRAWLHQRVIPAFSGRILPVDREVALRAAAFHVPNPRPIRDAFIAATALVHQKTVVTRDVADFEALTVGVIDLGRRDKAR